MKFINSFIYSIFKLILLGVTTIQLPFALTLETSESYYLVSPKNEHDIQNAIQSSTNIVSNDNHDNFSTVGLHEATYYTPQFSIKGINGQYCYVDDIQLLFQSKIHIPKLDFQHGRYNDKTLMLFNAKVKEITVHEERHRKIYTTHLQSYVNQIRSIKKHNTRFSHCNDLKKHIEQKFETVITTINQQNLDFDCYEYGKSMHLNICQQSKIRGQKAETPKFASNHSQSTVQRADADTNASDCDGKLIEPFKGKFYCVPADSYSENPAQ